MSDLSDETRWQRDEEPLDFSPSSGSVGVPTHPDGPVEHDGRASTNTTFRPHEGASDSPQDWYSMAEVQDGKYAGGQSDMRKNHADQRRELATFCSHIDLTIPERQYAEHLLRRCHRYERDRDEDEDGSFYSRGETLVLAVLTFAANHFERRIRGNDSYEKIRSDCNVDRKAVRSERESIRQIV